MLDSIRSFWPVLVVMVIAVGMTMIPSALFYFPLVLMIFPLLDKQWANSTIKKVLTKRNYWYVSAIVFSGLMVLAYYSGYLDIFIRSFFFAALPEEWFFRAYLLTSLMSLIGGNHRANIICSICFSIIHTITRGYIVGVLVFIPSLIYGYIYQKTKSFSAVVFIHGISNTIFFMIL